MKFLTFPTPCSKVLFGRRWYIWTERICYQQLCCCWLSLPSLRYYVCRVLFCPIFFFFFFGKRGYVVDFVLNQDCNQNLCCNPVSNYRIWSSSSLYVRARAVSKSEEAQIIHTLLQKVFKYSALMPMHIHWSVKTQQRVYKNVRTYFIKHNICSTFI